jgi:hypothetical protein
VPKGVVGVGRRRPRVHRRDPSLRVLGVAVGADICHVAFPGALEAVATRLAGGLPPFPR